TDAKPRALHASEFRHSTAENQPSSPACREHPSAIPKPARREAHEAEESWQPLRECRHSIPSILEFQERNAFSTSSPPRPQSSLWRGPSAPASQLLVPDLHGQHEAPGPSSALPQSLSQEVDQDDPQALLSSGPKVLSLA